MSLDILTREYPGDIAWWKFVDVVRAAWKDRSDKSAFLSIIQDEDVAIVLAEKLGAEAFERSKAPISALSRKSPADASK
jgi:hypothetical protein